MKSQYFKDGLIEFNKNVNSPHSIIANIIKPSTKLLDIGCNAGLLGKELLKKNVFCDGIDINKKLLNKAKKYYKSVYKIDLSTDFVFNQNKYDYIVMSDILEHLPRPDITLQKFKKNLKKNGFLITSIPNVARFELRLKHLFGNFDYKPGIMSQDHLRFFTKKSASELITNADYKIVKIIPTGLGHNLNFMTELTAFQFIFIATV